MKSVTPVVPDTGSRPRRRLPALAAAPAAMLLLLAPTGCSSSEDTGPSAKRPKNHNLPEPHGPGTDIDYPSQSQWLRPGEGMDFSVFLRLDDKTSDEWQVVGRGDKKGLVRYKTAKTVDGTPGPSAGSSTADRTRYFVFHAEKPGRTTLTLRDPDTGRTMTYNVMVVENDPAGPEDLPVETPPPDRPLGRKISEKFEGTVTVKRGQRFAVANSYSNEPGITWRVTEDTHDDVVYLDSDGKQPRVTGNPDGYRQDWYSFYAAKPGTTKVTLQGCYRCTSTVPSQQSAESRKFSETRTLTIRVR